jgi:hypothetical protein
VIAAIVAVLLLIELVTQMVDERTGILAGAFLWLHPLFLHLASTWNPYILGITLTIGALYTAHRYLESESATWFVATLAILIIAILNHTWEASIALPIVVLFCFQRRYKAIGAVIVTTAMAVGMVFAARIFQPPSAGLIQAYSVFYHPDSLVTQEWLMWGRSGAWQPWRYVIVFAIPMTVVSIIATGVGYLRTRSINLIVLGAWLASGLIILILVPRGWLIHEYYAWALPAPLAATAAWGISWLLNRLTNRIEKWSDRGGEKREIFQRVTVHSVLAILLITATASYAITVHESEYDQTWMPDSGSGFQSPSGYPAQAAGMQLAATPISDPEQVVFVGDWGDEDGTATASTFSPDVVRTLIYSDMLLREPTYSHPGTPRFAPSVENVTECEAMVIANSSNRTIEVERC